LGGRVRIEFVEVRCEPRRDFDAAMSDEVEVEEPKRAFPDRLATLNESGAASKSFDRRRTDETSPGKEPRENTRREFRSSDIYACGRELACARSHATQRLAR
jgi:hypothetical protein